MFSHVMVSQDVEAGCVPSTSEIQAQRLVGYLYIFHRTLYQAAG